MEPNMRSGHFVMAALGIALLLGNPCIAFADDFALPPPPVYKEVKGKSAIENLRDIKVAWLEKKKAAEDKYKKSLERQSNQPDADKDSYKESIKKYDDMSKQDQKDLDELTPKDAVDPSTNGAVKAHAKLIKTNVEAWIKTLEADYDAATHKDHPDNKELQKIAGEEKALKDALAQAQKDLPRMFE
jgi:hypothetical protein